jgi:hypothetical protein
MATSLPPCAVATRNVHRTTASSGRYRQNRRRRDGAARRAAAYRAKLDRRLFLSLQGFDLVENVIHACD